MFLTFIVICIFMGCSNTITHFFTSNDEIALATQSSFWSLFLYIFFSTVKGVQNGVVRALGLQKTNSVLTLLFAYGLGIPLAALFCFAFKMGLAGMWFGVAIANGALVVAIHRMQKSANWEEISEGQQKIKKRKHLITSILNEEIKQRMKPTLVANSDSYSSKDGYYKV